MIYCSVKYCCSNSSIPGVILHSFIKSIKTPNHPAYHWSTLWPLEVWVRGLYNSWGFCVHKLSMFIYLSMFRSHEAGENNQNYTLFKLEIRRYLPHNWSDIVLISTVVNWVNLWIWSQWNLLCSVEMIWLKKK